MLSVVMLIVIMPNVVAPDKHTSFVFSNTIYKEMKFYNIKPAP
jgi:hypothetical protein